MGFTNASPLKSAWRNPQVRHKLENYILSHNFEIASGHGHAFIKELDNLCKEDLSEERIFDKLRSFFQNQQRLQISVIQDRKGRLNRRAEQVVEILGSYSPTSLLDIGCGSGEITNELMGALKIKDKDMLGLEIVVGKNKFPFKIVQYEGTKLPVENDSFDFATIFSVLHHAEEPEKVIQEIARVIKPGGLVVVRECDAPTHEDWLFNLVADLLWYKVYTPNPNVPIPGNYLSHKEWASLFEKEDFKHLRTTFPEPHNPYNPAMILFQKQGLYGV